MSEGHGRAAETGLQTASETGLETAAATAAEMLAECLSEGQAARRVTDDGDADGVRAELRRLARADGVRIRTARMDDTVVVARTDAQIWDDPTSVMRAKLTPR